MLYFKEIIFVFHISLVTFLTLCIFTTTVAIKDEVGAYLGYNYCVSCTKNCYTRGENFINYGVAETKVEGEEIALFFSLCDRCYKTPKVIDYKVVSYFLYANNWNINNIKLVLIKIKKLKNRVLV